MEEIISFDTHSTANLQPWTILEKNILFFSKKTNHFFEKIRTSNLLEKSYYFNRIRPQICYNLVLKNFHIQNRRVEQSVRSDIFNWKANVKNNVRVEWMIFLPYYKNGWKIVITLLSLPMNATYLQTFWTVHNIELIVNETFLFRVSAFLEKIWKI